MAWTPPCGIGLKQSAMAGCVKHTCCGAKSVDSSTIIKCPNLCFQSSDQNVDVCNTQQHFVYEASWMHKTPRDVATSVAAAICLIVYVFRDLHDRHEGIKLYASFLRRKTPNALIHVLSQRLLLQSLSIMCAVFLGFGDGVNISPMPFAFVLSWHTKVWNKEFNLDGCPALRHHAFFIV